MSHFSTPEEYKGYCKAMKKEKENLLQEPGKKVMALIMQFAHSYYVEKKLPINISGIILN